MRSSCATASRSRAVVTRSSASRRSKALSSSVRRPMLRPQRRAAVSTSCAPNNASRQSALSSSSVRGAADGYRPWPGPFGEEDEWPDQRGTRPIRIRPFGRVTASWIGLRGCRRIWVRVIPTVTGTDVRASWEGSGASQDEPRPRERLRHRHPHGHRVRLYPYLDPEAGSGVSGGPAARTRPPALRNR